MGIARCSFSISNRPCRIRRAGRADLPGIYEIETQSFKDPYPREVLENLLSLYPYGFFVAEGDGRLLGYVIVRLIKGRGHVIALAVAGSHRRRGIGSSLLARGLEELRRRGAGSVWLEVRASNVTAQRFYLSQGFERLATISNYYDDLEDAVIYTMPLLS